MAKRYSAKAKAEAVGAASVLGQAEASRVLDVPTTSLNRWYNDARFGMYRDAKKPDLEEAFWVGIQVGLKSVVEGFDSDAPLGQKAVAFGVIYDKYALITGQATARTEALTAGLNDHERETLNRVIHDVVAEPA
jgi:hypothetical protein